MILTSQDQWTDLYASIKEESRKSDEKFVFIYASAQDCDAICALRILEVRQGGGALVHGGGDGGRAPAAAGRALANSGSAVQHGRASRRLAAAGTLARCRRPRQPSSPCRLPPPLAAAAQERPHPLRRAARDAL